MPDHHFCVVSPRQAVSHGFRRGVLSGRHSPLKQGDKPSHWQAVISLSHGVTSGLTGGVTAVGDSVCPSFVSNKKNPIDEAFFFENYFAWQ
ncbi:MULTISPECIES: hypothetical protein [Gimesia]|uniref:hypothetical protein n=1 Tax=Gimesia TaxID=1649453 RepID=UPI0011A564B2|nr:MULTISPECIES: hypothetical protein [Gimesia]